MVLSLKIEKEFAASSERVKSLDIHPTQPWILTSLHTGTICIWNVHSQAIEKSIKVTDSPVRSAKFVARKGWIVAGADDGFIRVYDSNTMEKIAEFEAHKDYIRCVAVHPTLPCVLSASDDHAIRHWDWESDWSCVRIFEGHSHYVFQVAFDLDRADTFASASLDATIMIWDIGSSTPIFKLDGHSKGVNCVDFFVVGGKPHLITGSDDFTVKIWDYETKTCVQTLDGHSNNVTAICVHPELPVIITGSEDETVRIWNRTTHHTENTLSLELGRVWTIGSIKGSDKVVFGCDKGIAVVKIINSVSFQA